jgi:hypothetical protein
MGEKDEHVFVRNEKFQMYVKGRKQVYTVLHIFK